VNFRYVDSAVAILCNARMYYDVIEAFGFFQNTRPPNGEVKSRDWTEYDLEKVYLVRFFRRNSEQYRVCIVLTSKGNFVKIVTGYTPYPPTRRTDIGRFNPNLRRLYRVCLSPRQDCNVGTKTILYTYTYIYIGHPRNR